MKRTSVFSTSVLLLFVFTGIHAQKEIPKEFVKVKSGYVDLGGVAIPRDAQVFKDISLGRELLKLAASSGGNGDSYLSRVLSDIYYIRVKSFQISSDKAEGLKSTIGKIEAALNRNDWDRIVTAKNADTYTNVSVKYERDTIVGLVVMNLDSGGALFANIVGKMDLEKIRLLTSATMSNEFDGLKEHLERK